MKNIAKTITIGIPAYNEARNIEKLLQDVVRQEISGARIGKILVYSDGSTDSTNRVVKTVKDKRIHLMVSENRGGIAVGLNQLLKKADGDVFVALDADIRIPDTKFVEKLISPILEKKAELTSSAIYPVTPRSLVAKALLLSMDLKFVIFKNLNKGNNVYTCFGLARAFSKSLYKDMHFPISIGNDMYSYFLCKQQGFRFRFVEKAVARYALPAIFSDHKKQSTRFLATGMELEKVFGRAVVHGELRIPKPFVIAKLPALLSILIKRPHLFLVYVVLQIRIALEAKKQATNTWEIAASSKEIYV